MAGGTAVFSCKTTFGEEKSDERKVSGVAQLPRHERRTPGPAEGHDRRADLRQLLPGAGLWHRRPSRRAGRGHQPHEPVHRVQGDAWFGQVPAGDLRAALLRRLLRQPHPLHRFRPPDRRDPGGDGRARVHLPHADAHAHAVLRRAPSAHLRRRDGHRVPQPRQVQRLQGLRRGRLPDHHRGRRPHLRLHLRRGDPCAPAAGLRRPDGARHDLLDR